MTIEVYTSQVIEIIDNNFGDGFSKKNPSLVGTLVSACVEDYKSGLLSDAVMCISESVGRLVSLQEKPVEW